MFKVCSRFIGQFKTGDNINYNLSCLHELYEAQRVAVADKRDLFCKPITILLTSIVEALLHDLFYRIEHYTNEGMNNVAKATLKKIRTQKIDQFGTYISSARKHDLLDAIGTRLYERLDFLRRLRNRIHIQNTKRYQPLDENRAFTFTQQRIAEQALEMVMRKSSEGYLRPEHAQGFVEEFELPWNEHYPAN